MFNCTRLFDLDPVLHHPIILVHYLILIEYETSAIVAIQLLQVPIVRVLSPIVLLLVELFSYINIHMYSISIFMECLGNRKLMLVVHPLFVVSSTRSVFVSSVFLTTCDFKTDRFIYEIYCFSFFLVFTVKIEYVLLKDHVPLCLNLTQFIHKFKNCFKISLQLYLRLYMQLKELYQSCNWYKIYGNQQFISSIIINVFYHIKINLRIEVA